MIDTAGGLDLPSVKPCAGFASIGAAPSSATVLPAGTGTVLVGRVGQELVVKRYPRFQCDLFESERSSRARR
jgi:hypothetical protein